MYQQIAWLVILIAFAVLEGITAGLVSVWFCLGSLVALIASWLGAGLWVQIVLFAVVSVAAMAVIRPLARKYLSPKQEKTNADRILDEEGVVLEEINNLGGSGQIKVKSTIWTARSADGSVIPVEELVRVKRIEGVKAIVTKVEKGQG